MKNLRRTGWVKGSGSNLHKSKVSKHSKAPRFQIATAKRSSDKDTERAESADEEPLQRPESFVVKSRAHDEVSRVKLQVRQTDQVWLHRQLQVSSLAGDLQWRSCPLLKQFKRIPVTTRGTHTRLPKGRHLCPRASLRLVVRPGTPSSVKVVSLHLVARPGAPSSISLQGPDRR